MTAGVLSHRLARLPGLAAFLGEPVAYRPLPLAAGAALDVLAGWGRGPKALAAQRRAARSGLPFLALEDGFLRSLERRDPPLSLVLDDEGLYYDAAGPSRLERLIAQPLGAAERARAAALAAAWRAGRVSKYNHGREYAGALPDRYVLVCDQTFADASIRHGQAAAASFDRMLEAALAEHPDAAILVKTHPDRVTRGRRGYFDPAALARRPRVQVIAGDWHPVRLLEAAEAVYSVTSQMGFEALLWGKPVRVFGLPFYAGWGLTEDELPPPARRGRASLEQLVHAALIAYPRYRDPESGAPCAAERVLEHLALQRRLRERFPAEVHARGFSRWKRPILRRFLAGSKVRFAPALPPGRTLAVWGRSDPGPLPPETRLLRIEDGFLRSVGLGADLVRPLSWVCDGEGIYYDATRPSDLERILATADFDEALLARARALRQAILAAGLTKYNLAGAPWRRPAEARRVVLVPGQVEDDASIRYGAAPPGGNAALLRAVRAAEPDAFILYKPHPDVVAGLRDGGQGAALCDACVTQASMAQLLEQVDAVHTLTSLAGFEALLRGREVTCHGQPFYAGWGLTRDRVPHPRRTRRLTLDALVAASLILYPVYVSRVTGCFTTPEQAVRELALWRAGRPGGLPAWRRALRPLLRVAKRPAPSPDAL